MRKIITTFALLLLSAVSLWAQFEIDGIRYKLNNADKTAEVSGCSASEIVIPPSIKYGNVDYAVTSIGTFALMNASILTVSIPTSVTSIGVGAFYSCTGLTSVSLSSPSSVKSIGEGAFQDCTSLTDISIPSSVTSIGASTFTSCKSLKSFAVSEDNSHYSSDLQGILYNKDMTTLICCPGGKTGSVNMPSSVTSIGSRAFFNCTKLTDIIFPESVTSIGKFAFFYCTGLASITCETTTPPSVGADTFSGVPKNIPVTVPHGTMEAYKAAKGWQDFTNFVEAAATIDDFYYNLNEADRTAAVAAAPTRNSYTGDIVIPASVKYGDVDYAVTSIGESAFEGCTSLTSINIPSSVTSIGERAFDGCTGLTDITCESTTPPSVGTNAFGSIPTNIPVTVPHGAVEAYKKAGGWSKFTNFVEAEATAVGTVQADKGLGVSGRVVSNPEGAAVRVFTLGGAQVLCSSETVIDLGGLPTGVYVVRANGMGQKVVVR